MLDVLQLYAISELQEVGNKYVPNLGGMWEEDFLAKLTPNERAAANAVTLDLPLVGTTRYPLEFYSNPVTQRVTLPIASIKFIDDLAVAFAYYDRKGCDVGAVSDYAAALRFQPQNAKGSPLDALGVPRDATTDPYVDDVSMKILKSNVYFVAVHEYAHVMYRHRDYGVITVLQAQRQEAQSDAFGLEIMGRIGAPPVALTYFFLIASRLEASPGDFASLGEYERYLRTRATHPVSAQRIYKVAEGIEARLDAFARLQRDPASAKNKLHEEAQKLRQIAATLDDRQMRQFLAQRAIDADMAAFRRACR